MTGSIPSPAGTCRTIRVEGLVVREAPARRRAQVSYPGPDGLHQGLCKTVFLDGCGKHHILLPSTLPGSRLALVADVAAVQQVAQGAQELAHRRRRGDPVPGRGRPLADLDA